MKKDDIEDIKQESTIQEDPMYLEFVKKFEPKRTTDDCYTPPKVYEAVLQWVKTRYAIPADAPIIRPFYPGGDYERETYPPGCVVVDNPPFSILQKICKYYNSRGIKFFLFGPGLTIFSWDRHCQYVFIEADVIYDNGAIVNTAFRTNMSDCLIECAIDLDKAIADAQKFKDKPPKPVYTYPNCIGTSSRFQTLVRHKIPFKIKEAIIISKLDAQGKGSGCFGKAVMLSEEDERKFADALALAERRKNEQAQERVNSGITTTKGGAIVFELSDREKMMQQMLSGKRVRL